MVPENKITQFREQKALSLDNYNIVQIRILKPLHLKEIKSQLIQNFTVNLQNHIYLNKYSTFIG